MRGETPKERATELEKILQRTYDRYGKRDNVIDMLTDLRHLCDVRGWDFADLDRVAYNNYVPEKNEQAITF